MPSEPPREPSPDDAEAASIKQGTWIWHDEPEVGAAVRYFRAALDIPEGRAIKSARGILTCDNFAALYVNGKPACKTDDELNAGWRNPVQVDLKPLLAAGRNVLAVRAENFDSQNANPAGLLGVFQVEFEQGPPIVLATGPAWKSCAKEQPGWAEPALDDSDWKTVKVLAKYGAGPWGDFLGTGGRPLTVSPIQSDPFWGWPNCRPTWTSRPTACTWRWTICPTRPPPSE